MPQVFKGRAPIPHSPEQWVAIRRDGTLTEVRTAGGGPSFAPSFVFLLTTEGASPEVWNANAKLIAAAPAMYAVLREIALAYAEHWPGNGTRKKPAYVKRVLRVLDSLELTAAEQMQGDK